MNTGQDTGWDLRSRRKVRLTSLTRWSAASIERDIVIVISHSMRSSNNPEIQKYPELKNLNVKHTSTKRRKISYL